MKNKTLLDINFEVWLLIADLHHKIVLVREKELGQYNITPRKLHVLRIIDNLGSKARISAIAKATDRKIDVISKQAVTMEKEGLIKRLNDTPKSRLLKIELTPKGRALLNISRYSNGMNEVLSILSKEELLQLDSVLNRLLLKLKKYDPETGALKLF
jgi:DNA-binding MarR family transcriptional regulator